MATYSLRCRNAKCRHRRVATRHPDEYIRVPKCAACGEKKGWRIEGREYNKRNLCHCSGPVSQLHGINYPHRPHHPMCEKNPNGLRNLALRSGAKPEDLPLELMGRKAKKNEPCPF